MKKILLLLQFSLLVLLIPSLSVGQVISTIAGNGAFGDGGDGGPATAAQFEYVWFTATDSAGNVFITDNFDHRVRKVSVAGIVTTFAGNGSAGFSGDGGPATDAQFIGASGIAADRWGNVYFADINNRRIRKVDAAGNISTVAGNGSAGFSGDGGPATLAQLNSPYGLAADDSGNIYIADELNFRIRKVSSTGFISTIAGSGAGGFSGDGGPATLAQFTPGGVAVDAAGNIYITTNNRVRKVNTSGLISTVAGTGIAGYSGDSGPATDAKLNQPVGIAVDGIGNLFVSDQYNNRIRKVSISGTITTVAGNGLPGSLGDGGAATSAELMQPLGISCDAHANIYFCDYGNHKIRKVDFGNHIPTFVHHPSDSIAVCENSIADSLNSLLAISDADTGQTETWTLLAPALHGTASVSGTALSTGGTVVPSGMTYSPLMGYSGNDTFIVRIDDGSSLDTITIYMRVKPLPDTASITGSATVCMGTPDTLADTAVGGVWSVTNTLAAISATGVVNGFGAGTDTVLNTVTVEGCSLSAAFPVTIYPVTDTITGPASVCTGLSIVLNGSPAGGAWNVTNGDASVSSGSVSGISAGLDTIIYSIANACGVFTTTKPVTVIGFTIPGVIISSSPATIISGQYDTLVAHITAGGGITYGYQWENNSTVIAGATDSVYISNSFHNGDSITCFINNGPCNFETFSWTYIVYHNDAVPAVTASGSIYLMPDPSNGDFFVKGNLPEGVTSVGMQITDLLGRVVYQSASQSAHGLLEAHVAGRGVLNDGMYFLQLLGYNYQSVLRFVIRK